MKLDFNIKKAVPLGFGALLAFTAPLAAAERIIFNCFAPPQYYMCAEYMPELKERIETATEGRVVVNVPPKSLSAPQDQYEAVVHGVMDGAIQFNGFLGAQVPGIQFTLLPFVGAAEGEVTAQAMWTTYQKFFGEMDEFGEAVLISTTASSGSEFYSLTDKPIMTVDDLRSRKVWVLPGSAATVVKNTGSPVVAGPAVQMLELVSKGVVDGYAGVQWDAALNFKLLDYTTSATVTEGKLFQPTFSVYLSRDKWEKISPEDQDAIMDAVGLDFARFAGRIADEQNAKGRAAGEAAGVEILEADPSLEADLRDLGQPLIEAWIAKIDAMGVDGQEVLDFYQAEIARFRAEMAE